MARSTVLQRVAARAIGRRAAAALVAVAALSFPIVGAADPAGATQSRPTGKLSPASGVLFGAHVKSEEGFKKEMIQSAVLAREVAFGRKFDMVQSFIQWNTGMLDWRETWHHNSGRIPLVSWGGTNTDEITSGAHDTYIATSAARVANFKHPLFLRWFWEMDALASRDRVPSPESFVAAWRRIHDQFVAAGATNAVWVWCPTSWGFETGEAQQYYPGDAYVDWVCADAFNWAPGDPTATWRSFGELFDAFYAFGLEHNKPMMIGAFGVQEGEPGDKARWLRDMAETLKIEYPAISGIVYFDANREYDWRVDTSPSSFDAYTDIARDPYFNARTPYPVLDSSMSIALDKPTAAQVENEVLLAATPTVGAGRTISRVEFWIGGHPVGSDATAPYEMTWDSESVLNGRYTVHARVYDTHGRYVRSAERILTVENSSPPTVELLTPTEDSISGSVWLSANASAAPGRSIIRVDFLVDGKVVAKDNTAPYDFTWNSRTVPNGKHNLKARAVDSAGFITGTQPRPVMVVNPSISLAEPLAGATVSGVVPLVADATAQLGLSVKAVEFYVGGKLVASDTTAPYRVEWDSTSRSNGTYKVMAKMIDSWDRVATSEAAEITVYNYFPPTVALKAPVDGVVENGPAWIAADASPSAGATITKVEFYVGELLAGVDTTPGWGLTFNTRLLPNGTYDVVAKVFDSAGETATSAPRTMTIKN